MAWTQANFNHYMTLVRAANPDYEKHIKSSIHEFTGLLKLKRYQDTSAHKTLLANAWAAVPPAKKQQYAAAHGYVMQIVSPTAPMAQPRIPVPTAAAVATTLANLRPVQPQPVAPPMPQAPNVAQQQAARIATNLAAQDRVCRHTIRQRHNGRDYEWPAKYKVRNTGIGRDLGVTVIVKLAAFAGNGPEQADYVSRGKVDPVDADHVGVPVTDEVKRNWIYRIRERWSAAEFVGLDARGDELEKYPIYFDIDWVATSAEASATVFAVRTIGSAPADGTVNTFYWGVDDGGNKGAAIAHEFGHLIGNPDEYGTCTFNGQTNRRNPQSIMDNETTGKARAGHYYLVAQDIAALLGVPESNAEIRLDGVRFRVNLRHPWA